MGNTDTGKWDVVSCKCLSWGPTKKKTQIKKTPHLIGNVVLGIHTFIQPIQESSTWKELIALDIFFQLRKLQAKKKKKSPQKTNQATLSYSEAM